jgi:hypothetical protein
MQGRTDVILDNMPDWSDQLASNNEETGLIKKTVSTTQSQQSNSINELLELVKEKKPKKKLQMDYDSSLSQLNSQEFIMDNETYIKLQHHFSPNLELRRALMDVRCPQIRELI